MLRSMRFDAVVALAFCVALLSGSVIPLWAATREKPPELTLGELVQKANKQTLFPLERIDALKKLGQQRDPQAVRDQRVIESLLMIVKSSNEDLFVRIAAITSIGLLQNKLFKTDNYAKNKYLEAFKGMLADQKESTFIRTEICKIFASTLDVKGLRDEKAFNVMLDIMDSRPHPTLGESLAVRIAATNAVGEFGNPKAFERLSNVLLKSDVDPLLKETVVRALYNLLSQVEDVKDQIKLPAINKLVEMVSNQKVSMEIRAEVMKALGRLYRHGVRGLDDAIAEIRKILKKEDKVELVVAAVEALGIAGDASALPVLEQAFSDFYQKEDPKAPKDLKIRKAILQTMGYLLAAQNTRRGGPDETAVRTIAKLLLKVINPESEKSEFLKTGMNKEVVEAAIFSLRYLYPDKTAFQTYHKRVTDGLLGLMKLKLPGKKGDPLVSGATRTMVIESLYFITEQPYGDNLERWERWFDAKYGPMPRK